MEHTREVNGEILDRGEFCRWEDYLMSRGAGDAAWHVARVEVNSDMSNTLTLVGKWYELSDALQGARADKSRRTYVII